MIGSIVMPTDSEIDLRRSSIGQYDQEKEQIKEYFEGLQKENINQKSKKISSETCEKVEESIGQKIMMKQLQIKEQANEIDLSFSQSTYIHPNELIEKNIKEQILRESMRTKQILEQKMKQLDQDINKIKTEVGSQTTKNQQDKELTEEEKKEKMQFLKEKVKERKDREKRRQQRLFEDEEKYKEELERKKIQEEQERKQKEILKKKELEQRMEDIKRSMKEREEKLKTENSELKKIKQQKPLYEKIIENEIKSDQETLELKKKKLAEIRDLHKPIDPNELKEHEKKFYENLRCLSEKAQSKKEKFEYKKPYISETYKKIEEERKQQLEKLKHPEEEEKKKGPNLLEKIQEYSKTNIKKPKIDSLKQSEMQKIIENLKHKPNFKWFSEKKRDKSASDPNAAQVEVRQTEPSETQTLNTGDISPRKLGNNYLNRLKEQRLRNSSIISSNNSAINGDNTLASQGSPIVKKFKQKKYSDYQITHTLRKGDISDAIQASNSYQITPMKLDYLKEQRIKNLNNQKPISELDRLMKSNQNMNSQTKAQYLLMHAEKLEKQALRKEQLMRVKGNYYSTLNSENNLETEILDTYINAIKAKFQVLESNS